MKIKLITKKGDKMRVSELFGKLGIINQHLINHEISGIYTHHNDVLENSIFVAVTGENVDSHKFINEAIKKGAKTVIVSKNTSTNFNVNIIRVNDTKKTLALLVNEFYNTPSKTLNIVGVTGTNGKTTVTHMINFVLNQLNQESILIGTLGVLQKDKYTQGENTTPNNLTLQKILYEANLKQIKNVVMEVSSHAIKQQRVSQVEFDTVIFTNLTHDHLDYHGSFDDYKYTKGLLFSSLGNYRNNKWAVLNSDDEFFPFFLQVTNTNIITYGKNNLADVKAFNIVTNINMISFDIKYHDQLAHLDMQISGEFNIDNALACVAYFMTKGYKLSEIVNVLSKFSGIDGRMELIQRDDFKILIDYAHTPDGVKKVLSDIRKVHFGELITIVGCGGDRDKDKRSIIGELVTRYSNKAIFTTDNPRNENPLQIINDMLKGVTKKNFIVIPKRKSAIKLAFHLANTDCLIVILGRGHEMYQTVGNEKIHFNDKEEVLKSLKEFKD